MTNAELEKARVRLYEKSDRKPAIMATGGALMALFGFIAFLNLIGSVNLALRPGQQPIERFLFWLVFAIMGFIGPYGFFLAKKQREIKQVERRLPDFLRDVAEAGRFGMTLADAIVVSSSGRYGKLTPEIKKMAAQITWGVPATEALRLLATRVKTPMVERVVAIIVKSSDAGGDVADVLTMVSHDTKENQLTEDERRITMSTYIAVIYISFMVFLVTIWILNVTFLPKMLEASGALETGAGGALAGASPLANDLPTVVYNVKIAFFVAVIVHGLGDGILAGVLDTGKIANGLRHSFILLVICVLAFLIIGGVRMSQSAEKVDTQAIEKLSRRKAATASRVADLDRERGEAKQMLDDLEKNRKAAVFGALDSIKKRYFGRLLGDRGIKVKAPKVSGVVETTLGKITTIPKIVQKNMNEIEIQPILKNYAYVRILYDTMANEYFYEAIEPKLIEEESELLDVLKEILVGNLELLEGSERAQKENYLRRMVDGVLRELGVELHPVSKERIMYFVFRDFIRYGPIDVVMTDVQVEDVSCDGVRVPLYIYHRKYGSIPSNLKFDSAEELDSFVIWLAQRSGKHISVAQPMLDATIPDGSRLQATLGMHVTKRGSSFTIRRFRENPFTPLDLVRFKTMSPEMMAYLWLAIENGQSMLICGGTASGKTTTLNAILLFIPPQMKIVSIEDTRELNLPHENWVPLLTRAGFGGKSAHTGKAAGEIDMFDLLTAALRQRPQYMMIGEVRGPEAFVVFQAMATGKSAYTTFHADDVQAMVHRLENDPINLPRALVAALDIVLLQAQVKVGTDMTRRVKAMVEVVGTDPESNELITNSAYTWNPADDTFNYSGHSYVYEKISLTRNWNQRRMEQEVKRRLDIFDYMKRTDIKNYRDVAKIVSAYYRDPDGMIKIVRDTLASQGVQVPAS